MEFVKLVCRQCGMERKFEKGSLRHQEEICGECWDWAKPLGEQ